MHHSMWRWVNFPMHIITVQLTVYYVDDSSKEEVREEGKKGLRKPCSEEEVWQNRSCDLPNFANMVKYLHKRVNHFVLVQN